VEPLRGIATSALKENDDVVEPLLDRIVGRTSLHDVYDLTRVTSLLKQVLKLNMIKPKPLKKPALKPLKFVRY
jgi:hypothetical protein